MVLFHVHNQFLYSHLDWSPIKADVPTVRPHCVSHSQLALSLSRWVSMTVSTSLIPPRPPTKTGLHCTRKWVRRIELQFRCNQSCQSQEGLLFGSYFLEALERLKNRIDSMHLNWKSLELKSNLPGIPEADSKAWMAPGGNVHTMTVMENKDGSFTTSTNNTSTPQFNSSFTSKVSLRMKTYLLFILEPELFMK